MKVALAHDLLTQLGGAERVLDELIKIFPRAPIYTLFYDARKTEGRYSQKDLRTSFLQKIPWPGSYKWFLPFMPLATSLYDLREFDLVISDASAFVKGVRFKSGAKHVCYCHTPTRYLWQDSRDYVQSLPYSGFVKIWLKTIIPLLRRWDYNAARRVTCFVANSQEVQRRIEKYYRRSSEVVYPPIDTDFFKPADKPSRDYFLVGGRQEPYKKTHLVIAAFATAEWQLKVFGEGSVLRELKASTTAKNIEFLGRVSDDHLRLLYQNAKALIFPALEDAGMMMLEAMSCGTPVIALRGGGALEFVKEGETGLFFDAQTPQALFKTLSKFNLTDFSVDKLVYHAGRFSSRIFRRKFSQVVLNTMKGERGDENRY